MVCGISAYYMLWQKQAFKLAKKLLNDNHFDLVHYITYVICVLPTYMHKLRLPFLCGLIGGRGYSESYRISDE